ncbi:MAG: hypothetical protein A2161_07975 [Candidatus Schekmanbacteria bacterium RBG_13_48_7]|uniref:Type I restriction modification DNA specificity domain-containing protein n=1 Tax=Candidatus Schekmanbacteria bacterium RBG_13_48_7 TaxID=1817878 RepID=A0A1F7RZY9_9BACT|nr:MAG: hypothetical protein A2161_07975 [Candidatus Schekmanbacteria bacterium RBG_13_48_7]
MEASATSVEIDKYKLRKGDVIVTKDSESWDDIAVAAYVSNDFNDIVCGYHLALIRHNSSLINSEFLFRSFSARGINYQFRIASTGITRYGLGKYWLDNASFLEPPLDEQELIASFLNKQTTKIDKTVKMITKSIEKLQEYRTALISTAVTGKIDVREVVI